MEKRSMSFNRNQYEWIARHTLGVASGAAPTLN